MQPQQALRISGGAFICLGLMVWSVLWFAPDVGVPLAAGNDKPYDVITTARGWGDINGMMFAGLGSIQIIVSTGVGSAGKEDTGEQRVARLLLLGNFGLTVALLCFATFHHLVLNHGPPPPVFIAVGTSAVVSHFGRQARAKAQ